MTTECWQNLNHGGGGNKDKEKDKKDGEWICDKGKIKEEKFSYLGETTNKKMINILKTE